MKKIIKIILRCMGILVLLLLILLIIGYVSNRHKLELRNSCDYYTISHDRSNPIENLTVEQMQADINELEFYIKNCYVNYDYIEKTGAFNFDTALNNLRTSCKQCKSMKNNDFVALISKTLYGWPDRHVELASFDFSTSFFVINHFDYYSTKIIVKKEGTQYVVVASGSPSVKKNWIYKSQGNDLYKIYSLNKNEELFRIETLSDKKIEQLKIKIWDTENKEQIETVSVSSLSNFYKLIENDHIVIQETAKQAYIRVPTFDPELYEDKNDLNTFVNYAKQARNKDLIVIDVRENIGGQFIYLQKFLDAFCSTNVVITQSKKLLWSPGIIQNWLYKLNKIQNMNNLEKLALFEAQGIENKIKKNPGVYYQIVSKAKNNSYQAIKNYKGKLIIIMDKNTNSLAEYLSRLFKGAQNVTIIGENSSGGATTGQPYPYLLSNSKCIIYLPCAVFSSIDESGTDDGKGLMPDYWILSDKELHIDLEAMGVNADLF